MHRSSILLASLILAALPCAAQTTMMKPGLWEIRQQVELSPDQQAKMAEAQKALANMPPEQKAMMEKMMAQHGVGSVSMGSNGITSKVCMSKEQSERNTPPAVTDAKSRCTHDVKRSGNVINTHFSCTDPVSEGDSEVTLTSNGYTSKTTITSQRKGKAETMKMNGEARWLGSDCGGLKPMGSKP